MWDTGFYITAGVGFGVGIPFCRKVLMNVNVSLKRNVNKGAVPAVFLATAAFLLTGCGQLSERAISDVTVYAFFAVCSVLILPAYFLLVKRKDPWMLLLMILVCIVNTGYCLIAASNTLEQALAANRFSYLGATFLPFAMIMIIMNVCSLKWKKHIVCLLAGFSTLVFFVAASPGYLDIYYKSVSLTVINGATVLVKEYGSWHNLYLLYILLYVAIMICMIVHAHCKRKLKSNSQIFFLAAAFMVNFTVWLIEQLSVIDYEFLSVSYVISELFLLSLCLVMQENERNNKELKKSYEEKLADSVNAMNATTDPSASKSEEYAFFADNLSALTQKERQIYDCYLDGMSTKEIMLKLDITENTLKYHNKNIYGKLGVKSRKQLCEIGRTLQKNTDEKR